MIFNKGKLITLTCIISSGKKLDDTYVKNDNCRQESIMGKRIKYSGGGMYKGIFFLITTSLLWGTSFPFIKIIVTHISDYTYTWLRSLFALAGLSPYVIYYLVRLRRNKGLYRIFIFSVRGGLLAGIAYALGLWLQGLGTRYTLASNSAFITGLSIVFVHLYTALIVKKYHWTLALSLLLSISGLYFLTIPSTGFNIGDLLVLVGAFMWALQVIVIDKYSSSNPFILTFFEMMPALLFIIPDTIYYKLEIPQGTHLYMIIYLALVCSDTAFALQVYGQRYISPALASIIFLLEPVFASIFAYIIINEVLNIQQIIGAILILLAMFIASTKKSVIEKSYTSN